MIGAAIYVWAWLTFRAVRRIEDSGKAGTRSYHATDERGEVLERLALKVWLVALALFAVAGLTDVIASATANGASAAVATCRELGVRAEHGEAALACLRYADSAAHGDTVGTVADVFLVLAALL